MPAYAESVGLAYLDLADIEFDESLVRQVPAVLARQHSCAPVLVDDKQLLMASPNMLSPEVEDELRLRTGKTVRTVLCAPAAINSVIDKFYPRETAAAEMAAGAPKPAAARTAKAAAKSAANPGPTRDPAEVKKQQKAFAIIAFNFTFMAAMFYQMTATSSGFFTKLGIGVLLGAVAAGTAWTLVGMRK
jgi:hypothetical protein